jgi:hypothetical protein
VNPKDVLAYNAKRGVVPAHAGTHNHRRLCQEKASTTLLKKANHAVWVPAFAGTTSRDYFASHPRLSDIRPLARRSDIRSLALLLLLLLLLLLPLLQLLLPGVAAAVDASGDGAEHAVMAGIVTGDAADRCALQAALGVGWFGSQRERRDGE